MRIAHSRLGVIVLAFAVSASLVSGCGDSDANDAVEGGVDTAQLDPGNYPTKPRTDDELATPAAGVNREAARLAEHVPLMMDIDSRLVYSQTNMQGRRYTPFQPPTHREDMSMVENFNEVVPGLVVGWGTGGQRRQEIGLGENANLRVLRFQTADQAMHAQRVLPDGFLKKYPEYRPIDIPSYSAARSFASPNGWVSTWHVRDAYLIYVHSAPGLNPAKDPTPAVDLAKKVLDKQIELLKGYQPTGVDQIPALPADIDGLFARTLPVEDAAQSELPEDDVVGVYPVEAGIHLSKRFDLDQQAFADAGVDLVSRGDSWVFRAKDDGAAVRLLAAELAQVDWQYKPTSSPPGMPDAKCFEKNQDDPFVTYSLMAPTCYFTVGRHVAIVEADQIQALHQKSAAQYLLLANQD
ncbi:DUF7373 family lipoprotein [Nocardia cyriacigeorgica]|jgi:hypothetical protein|uniref:DUF7373 family lipoprotein n=1 Tax=Nocardia cyriacigeorgica TaxID=135487 RepID=UPI000CEA507B|nr:hypothetical protein [Nocardia cyriacigeorgica]AVH20653.1 hypothetical protein C5B73_03350 [Nocardia cyriacigeorgica]MBF6325168.1 hypothetical protein [Nocardia cyriacigeorgica]MBF6498350.1 hypothetical protein [Nocardia cyriacigeorgica]PPJ02823.1 hypothetical protein C5E43_26095 [Nocardia cyriacigeorgica]